MRKNLRRILSYAFMVVAVALLVLAVVRERSDFVTAMHRVTPLAFVGAVLSAVAALLTSVLAWRRCLAATSRELPLRPVAHTVLVSALGKYIPGAVWPVVAQMELMRRYGVSRAESALASILNMIVGFGAAVVAGTVALFLSGGGIATYWWLLPVAAGCFLVLFPGVLRVGLRLVSRAGWRFAAFRDLEIKGRPLVGAIGWAVVGSLLNGLQAWILLRVLVPQSDPSFWLALAAAQLSWAVGFVVVIAPGGIGPREATLVALLSSAAGAPDALAFAILTRLIQVVLDGLGAGIAAGFGRWFVPTGMRPHQDSPGASVADSTSEGV